MAAVSWLILSHYAFVSQETLSYQLCNGRLTAKSVINLDMRWDYLHVTVNTINIKRMGWVGTKSKHFACNSIFVFELKTCVSDPFVLPRAMTVNTGVCCIRSFATNTRRALQGKFEISKVQLWEWDVMFYIYPGFSSLW